MVVEISDDVKKEVKESFRKMEKEVKIHAFMSEKHCLLCNETKDILDILQDLSAGKLIIEFCDCDIKSEKAKHYNIERHPALLFEDFPNIRFYGIPAGFEFGSFVEAIVEVANGVHLPEALVKRVEGIKKEINIKTFVTPTCPYCPRMVRTAQKFAMLNPKIMAEGIEATEFQELSQKYKVYGVPKTIINEKTNVDGLVPEAVFLDKIEQI